MLFNLLYIGLYILALIIRKKRICKDCDGNFKETAFQLTIVWLALYHFVGAKEVLYTVGIILISFIITSIIFKAPRKIVEKCSYCYNPWSKKSE